VVDPVTVELFDDEWRPDGWRARVAEQQPEWPDDDALAAPGRGRRLP